MMEHLSNAFRDISATNLSLLDWLKCGPLTWTYYIYQQGLPVKIKLLSETVKTIQNLTNAALYR